MAIRRKRSFSDLIDEYFKDLEEWTQEFGEPFAERPSWNLKNRSIEPLRETSINAYRSADNVGPAFYGQEHCESQTRGQEHSGDIGKDEPRHKVR